MNTLCIVPCSKGKIWDMHPDAGPMAARFVYTGNFSKKCQQYSIKFYPESWCILSAKYGFLFPEEIVPGPYNVSFNNRATNPVSASFLNNQAFNKNFSHYQRIVVLGGKRYVKMVKEAISDVEIVDPLFGCKGIGFMMKRINTVMERNFPF